MEEVDSHLSKIADQLEKRNQMKNFGKTRAKTQKEIKIDDLQRTETVELVKFKKRLLAQSVTLKYEENLEAEEVDEKLPIVGSRVPPTFDKSVQS